MEEVYPVVEYPADVIQAWIEFNDEFFTNADPYTATLSDYVNAYTSEFSQDYALSMQSAMLGEATDYYGEDFAFIRC